MSKELRKIGADEFARRLNERGDMKDKKFAFFLGAGCSITSGIPAAGSLVKDIWLPRLKSLRSPESKNLDEWAKTVFTDYDEANPAASYGDVMGELFFEAEERQNEIERLCAGKYPGFGYAALSKLIAQDDGRFNVVITTNFDDLMADALYLFTSAHPLVIVHESLANFIRPTRTRPLIVKLHGDAHLSPQNTADETQKLSCDVESQVAKLLNDRGIIFIGYGGNDQGIANMLQSLPSQALPYGIYWVSGSEPINQLRNWLEERSATWVEKFDFDELMLLVRDVFNLPHPDQKPFEAVFRNYEEAYKRLSDRIHDKSGADDESAALKEAAERADKNLPGWFSVYLEAKRIEKNDPDLADKIFQNGIVKFQNSAELIGNYANFLRNVRHDDNQAEIYYKRALEADPNEANHLGNYANFLADIRHDVNQAEIYYKRALEVDPKNANHLGNYAIFLTDIRHDVDQAEIYYKRALEADPNEANHLGNYANYLKNVRHDADQAETYYKRALEADPKNANHLGNYANFLADIRHDADQAEIYYKRALEADPKNTNHLGNYATFLADIRHDADQAEIYFKRALEADPNHANNLGNYANFLKNFRHDADQAEIYYKRALEAAPNSADIIGGYAIFLTDIRHDADQAEAYYKRALEADPNNANHLGNYAGFLLGLGRTEDGLKILEKVIQKLPDPNIPGLAAEVWFYAYAHWPKEHRGEALHNLKKSLLAGERSPGWNLSGNIARAEKDGHPAVEWLKKLAQVITEGADIKVLEKWSEWKKA